jgi:hypothetical protein
MDLATFERETARNRKAYQESREQIRRRYAGQYIAPTDGQVVAAAPSFDAVQAAIERLPRLPEYFLIFSADEDPVFEPFYDYRARP